MPSVYLTSVTGDGQSIATARRASGFDGVSHATLMIDEAKKQAIVASPVDTVTGTGVTRILTGPTWEELRAQGKRNSPTNPQRKQVNDWLLAAGYAPLTSAQVTWEDCVLYAARQVNPAATLDGVYAQRLG